MNKKHGFRRKYTSTEPSSGEKKRGGVEKLPDLGDG